MAGVGTAEGKWQMAKGKWQKADGCLVRLQKGPIEGLMAGI